MSLVQVPVVNSEIVEAGFQYIICRWFNKKEEILIEELEWFQYIICRWFN